MPIVAKVKPMRTITTCRSCQSDSLVQVVNFGEQYLSDFRSDDTRPPKYPLDLVFCTECTLVQLRHTSPSGEMYHENYGFKSGISNSIKADLKEIVEQALELKPSPKLWLDIASNDGTLLSYVPNNIGRIGIDPIKGLCLEAKQHAEVIYNDFFHPSYFKDGMFDVITSISMFYDLDDPNEFVSGVAGVLAEMGVWVIQQNYLLSTMELNAIDNICHEHLEYYTLLSLEPLLSRHGLEIFKLSKSTINGGSIRTFVAHKGEYPIGDSVVQQRMLEVQAQLTDVAGYKKFGEGATKTVGALRSLVNEIVADGKNVYIYAASTRGATIWQAAGLGPDQITATVERNPAKVGKMFSSIGVPIISEEQARAEKPDYILIGPWFYADEILDREKGLLSNGTKAIIPLPELRVV